MTNKIALGLLCLFVTVCAYSQNMNNSLIQSLANQYKMAHSEDEKIAICIKAINSGVLCRGCSINVVDQLFGTNYSSSIPQKGQPMSIGVVDFLQQQTSMADRTESVPFRGWYFAFEYDFSGKIQNYYLTNLHK